MTAHQPSSAYKSAESEAQGAQPSNHRGSGRIDSSDAIRRVLVDIISIIGARIGPVEMEELSRLAALSVETNSGAETLSQGG